MIHSIHRLSDRERQLLMLLAQGHTAKTIATDSGLSVNVVNEHLRVARRKTGASSSRELARLVAGAPPVSPQENRDKLIGVERRKGPSNLIWRGVAIGAGTPLRNWRTMMALGILIAAGLLGWQTSVPETVVAPPPPGAPDLIYQVILRRGDEVLASPTVAGEFGQEVSVETPNLMRVTMIAQEPDESGRSDTTASMAVFHDDAWRPTRRMSMKATLSALPSFEYSVEGTPYRFVVLPRLLASSDD